MGDVPKFDESDKIDPAHGADLARNGPTVLALAPVLGLTDTQVDDMFRQAAALEV
jgi:hypothetical protein